MNGNVLSRVTLCGVLGLVAAAHGQVRKVPTAFMWQSDPGSGQNPPVYNPRFVSKQSGAVHEEPDFDNPVNAANRLALKIHENFAAGSITADNIAIYLHGFGYDHTLCDSYPAAPCPDDDLVTRFFTDEDALLLGMDEDDFPDRPLPNKVNQDARTFRHPFLRNATKQGPLRVWAEAFMDAFDAKITQIRTNPQHNPYRPDLPHPSVYRWYFDTESWFALPGNRNGVVDVDDVQVFLDACANATP